MSAEEIIEEARLRQLEGRWKSDVDLKLDKLVAFADRYEKLLEMLVKREAKREIFRDAVIEKTTSALILAGVLGLLALVWAGVGSEIKAIVNSVRGK